MADLIVLHGAPGSGKTTLAKLLKKKLRGPHVDIDWIRQFHLDDKWTNAGPKDEAMAFENIAFILRNYLGNGYKNIVVTGLSDLRIRQILKLFPKADFRIISLVVNDPHELKKRVLTETRDSGWRDYKKAIVWNAALQKRKLLKNEVRLDNTLLKSSEAIGKVLTLIKSKKENQIE